MQINNFPSFSLERIQNRNNKGQRIQFSSQQDTFEKSNAIDKSKINTNTVSFKGDNPFESMLDSIFDLVLNDFTSNLTSLFKKFEDEIYVQKALTLLQNNKTKQLLSLKRMDSISSIFQNISLFDKVIPYFEKAGINKGIQLSSFIRIYSKAKTDYEGQELEAIAIYGNLTSKEDLANYGEILLHLYNTENSKKQPNFKILNEYTQFLKDIGVQKFSEFSSKFEYLKPQYNDFETPLDKFNAVKDLKESHPKKIEFLSQLLNENPALGKDAKKVYNSAPEIIDYYYDKNNSKSLKGLEDVLGIASQEKKMRSQSISLIAPAFNNFSETENKIQFFKFLAKTNVSANEFSAITTKTFVERDEQDFLKELRNKEPLSIAIAKLQGKRVEDGVEFYKKFNDVINSLYNEDDEKLDGIESLIKVANTYKIKNSEGILRLYSEITGNRTKSLTKQEVKDFIKLLNYSETNVLEIARKQKTTPLALLEKEKAVYEQVQSEIESVIEQDDNNLLQGETADNLHKRYKAILHKNPENVATILEAMINQDLSDKEQYSKKLDDIKSFANLFTTKADFRKFINSNGISFEQTPENQKYNENILDILTVLKETSDTPKEYRMRLSNLTESGFFAKSKEQLSDFLAKIPNKEIEKELMSIIADKKVPSLNALDKFFEQYHVSKTSEQKLLEYLAQTPENIDFNELISLLEELQNTITTLDLPLEITADNISCINMEIFQNIKTLSTQDIVELLNKMYNVPENENFLTKLPASKVETSNNITANDIAQELVFKLQSNPRTYRNIINLLKLDKRSLNLPHGASNYIYISAIEAVLPQKFIDFVNDSSWLNYDNNQEGKIPNIVLHARLRAIDRFALNGANSIDELYTEETKEKLKGLFRTVYTQDPSFIKGTDRTKRIIVDNNYNDNVIEAVFAPRGELITIVQKRNS